MNIHCLKLSQSLSKILFQYQLSTNIRKCRQFHWTSSLSTKSTNSLQSNSLKQSDETGKTKIKGRRLLLRTPKGTFDRNPQQMAVQQHVLSEIVGIFQKHGAETIDTPVLEYKDVLTEKYGEESKLIYDFEEDGGETLSMRYDLTVPLARYVAMYKVGSIKRYQIGKVYRRDEPVLKCGRYCEFLQCDFDIVGPHDPMLPDAECVKVIAEILNSLKIDDYVIKLNHRQILDGIFTVCGVSETQFRSVCSAIDKLDKRPWCEVRQELIVERDLDETIADKIGEYVQLNGGLELIEKLLNDENLNKVQSAVEGLESMRLLLKYCSILGLDEKILFDLSLARGLDYYTGAIMEAVLKGNQRGKSFGSLAAGGRYDNLVGMFDAKGKSIPCVGISIGVERILLMLEAKHLKEGYKPKTNMADVFVVTPHRGLGEERLKLVNKLWDAGIRCENSNKLSPKVLLQFQHCEENNIPFALIIGKSELERGVVKIKELSTRNEEEVPVDDVVEDIRRRLSNLKE